MAMISDNSQRIRIDVRASRERLRGHVRHTPLLPSRWLSQPAGRPILLKAENLQQTGSFKARGALNFLLSLSPDERERGVVTASAGNHGQALAWAANRLGIQATVVLPLDAVSVKVERTVSWGPLVTVARHGHGYDEAHAYAERLAIETGAVYASAYDHPAVMAGQGTVALEILADEPHIEGIVVPVGGGGLVVGVATAMADVPSRPWVLGVQSDRTSALHDALRAGRLTPVEYLPTLADGLAGETCQNALDLCRALGITVGVVPEETLLPAIRETLLREHLAIEGSAATAIAAVPQGLLPPGDGPVALVLSGGNVAPEVLSLALM